MIADPSSGNSAEDWQARWNAVLEAGRLNDAVVAAIERIQATRRDLDAVAERIRLAHAEALRYEAVKEKDLPLSAEAKAVREGLEKLEKRFWWPRDTVGITPDTDVMSRLYYVRGYLGSSWSRPNPTHLEYLRQARVEARRGSRRPERLLRQGGRDLPRESRQPEARAAPALPPLALP